MARFTALSASLLFGFGFFSSISETVSIVRWAGLAGSEGFSTGFAVDVTGTFGGGGTAAFGFSGASTAAGLESFAGECGFALFVSLAGSLLGDEAGALAAGLRTVVLLRAVVVFVVVFVAIRKF